MALETVTYISDLVVTNPAHSDGLNAADAHLRAIKSAIKTTFPNITGAVTATQADINGFAASITALQTAVNTNGVTRLAHGGTFFDNGAGAASTDGFQNTLAGDIDVVLQGTVAATFQRTLSVNTLKIFGGITATGEIKGPGITPIGAAVMWFEDTLPTDGMWAWANGQIIANANTVAPVLLARWGTRFGGNGTTTMGVPNMQEVVPVGKSGMGGAAAPGLLTSIAAGVKDVLLALFGTDTVTLTAGQIPTITSGNTNNVSVVVSSDSSLVGQGQAQSNIQGNPANPVIFSSSWSTLTSRGTIGAGAIAAQSNNTGGTAHSNLGPRRAVNWIIRLG